MRLSRGIYTFLARVYRSVLVRCLLANAAGLALLIASPAFATDSALNLEATNGAASVSGAQSGSAINISGKATTINITPNSTLTINSPGGKLSNAGAVKFEVAPGASLNLSGPGPTPGVNMGGSPINLDAATLSLSNGIFNNAGEVTTTSSGHIIITNGGYFHGSKIGSMTNPMSQITINDGRLDLTGALYVDELDLTDANIKTNLGVSQQDWGSAFSVSDSTIELYSSTIEVQSGNISLGNVLNPQSGSHSLNWSQINALGGGVSIHGNVNVNEGLTSVLAAKNITINGDMGESDDGHFHLHANGNISAPGKTITALKIEAGNTLSAGGVNAQDLLANKLNVSGDVSVVSKPIPAGSLGWIEPLVPDKVFNFALNGSTASSVGGNLALGDVKAAINELSVGKSAVLTNVTGDLGNLSVKNNFSMAGGDATVSNLTAQSVTLASPDKAGKLQAGEIDFKNGLTVGQNSTLTVKTLSTDSGTIAAKDGGKLITPSFGGESAPISGAAVETGGTIIGENGVWAQNLAGGDGSVIAQSGNVNLTGDKTALNGSLISAPAGNINISGNAKAALARSTGAMGALIAAHEINIDGSLTDNGSGALALSAGDSVSATGNLEVGALVTPALIAKGAVTVTNGHAQLSRKSEANGFNLNNSTASIGSLASSGPSSFTDSQVLADTLSMTGGFAVSGGQLVVNNLYASQLATGGSERTDISIGALDGESGASIGANSFVTIGATDQDWLSDSTVGIAKAAGIAGIKEPLRLGEKGSFYMTGSGGAARSAGELGFAPESLLVVPGETAQETVNPQGMISSSTPKTANVSEGAQLRINGIAAEKVYVVLGDGINTQYAGEDAWGGPNLTTDSHLLQLRKIENRPGSFIAKAQSATDTYPGLDSGIGDIIDGGHTPPATTVPSTPLQPSTPVVPGNPGNTPANPVAPGNPGNAPINPVIPGAPDNPGDLPNTPENPANPEYPSNPGTPGEPGNPDAPDNPENPDKPANPDSPGANPSNPVYPNQPGNPSAPENPGNAPLIPAPELGTEDRHFNSDYAGVRFLSRVTSVKYMDHDYALATQTLESASRMVVLGAVPQMTAAANNAASEGASLRTALLSSTATAMAEASYGDSGHSFALWIMPMFQTTSGYGMTAGNFGYDFYGGLGGATLGADWTWLDGNDLFRLGIDFNMGGGYALSGGDLAKVTNNMGFWGAGVYGAWLHGDFGLAADAQFTASWNSLKQELPESLEMSDITGDVTASAISAGLAASYKIPLGDNWLLTPHAGVRYIYLTTDNYAFYSNGAMMDGSAIHQNIWSFPLGATLSGMLETESGWKISPSLDLSVIPAAGDFNAKTTIQYSGVSRSAEIETQTMDYITGRASLGVEMSKNDFCVGVSYAVQGGMKSLGQSIFGTLRYEF